MYYVNLILKLRIITYLNVFNLIKKFFEKLLKWKKKKKMI